MNEQAPSKGLLEGLRHNERSIANEPWLQDMCGNAADEIERLEAELEQANDIRSDREILIELMRGALGVSIEPHQTLSERLVEAAGRSNVDWCCPHYKPRGEGCTECRTPEPAPEQDTGRYCVEVVGCDRNADFHIWDGHCNTATSKDAEELQARLNRADPPPLSGHAAWQRDRMATWISKNKPALPDHACAQCMPGGEIVVEDFECVYHMALKITQSSGPTKGCDAK